MAQEVLYRKWRPNRFSEVFGHDAIVETLKNAVKSDRISHAYMFSGPRGTGKTTLARVLSKAVNCESMADGDACGDCSSCVAHDTGRAIDLIEIDSAAGHGADGIRELAEKTIYAPVSSRYKVYILDEVHALGSAAAFTALLKVLEEPPPHVIFAFATTEVDKVIPTVLSRCQRFDLSRIPMDIVIQRLTQISDSEGFTIDDAGYKLIARYATGSLRDAVNALDRVTASFGSSPNVEDIRTSLGLTMDDRAIAIAASIFSYDLKSSLMSVNSAVADGINLRKLTSDIVLVMRAILLTKAGAAEELEFNEDLLALINQLAKNEAIRVDQIIVALESLTRVASSKFSGSEFEPLPLEIAISSLALANHGIELPISISMPVRAQEPVRHESVVDVSASLEQPNLKDASNASSEAVSGQDENRAIQTEPAIVPEIVTTLPAPEVVTTPPAPEVVTTPPAPEIVTTPPVPEIVSSPPALDLNRIRGDWNLVKEHIREISKPAEALLAAAFPKSFESKNLEIGFLHQAHLQNFLDPKKAIANVVLVDALATSVAQVFEDSLTISFTHWPSMQQEEGDVTASESPSGGHLLSEALSLGGTLIEQE